MDPYQIKPLEFKTGKLARLEKIYALYERCISGEKVSCQKGCAGCCTCNVTMTGLEACYMLACMDPPGKKQLLAKLHHNGSDPRYLPGTTMNMFVRYCMTDEVPPEEENDPAWGLCPVLEKDACPVYPVRPFGCRALMSSQPCSRAGYAEVRPEILSLNHLFLQAIEHLDQGGWFGNFYDVLRFFLAKDSESSTDTLPEPAHLLRNEKIPVLMIPPEHRDGLAPVISKLTALV